MSSKAPPWVLSDKYGGLFLFSPRLCIYIQVILIFHVSSLGVLDIQRISRAQTQRHPARLPYGLTNILTGLTSGHRGGAVDYRRTTFPKSNSYGVTV